ncbi:glycosyl hydrolase [Flavobacteriaceae bacterium F08102]|nr:glycosyl hydrolase [Flavobacteriaceae bacterium F08102]
MKKLVLFISLSLFIFQAQAQSLVKNIPFKNIGPSIMSGRVVDLDVNPDKPSEFYVAYASGGLWYTNNNGTSFTSITENAPTQNMGDIAVEWNSGTIYIGTGESNSSRSSYAGIGILKSTDNGKTWTNIGLPNSQHIGRMVIHGDNPNHLVVGVIGNLYSSNKERGIYLTKDGGKTWTQTLFINEHTGVIDISASPTNPDILYAAAWERSRKAWDFKGNGPNSGIYKSTDGGATWKKLAVRGFPTTSGVGRIGLSAFNDKIVYAFLDNQDRRPVEKKRKNPGLKKDDFKSMTPKEFFKLDKKDLTQYLRSNGFDKKYTPKYLEVGILNGKIKVSDLATYLEDANTQLFDSPVIGAELYKSTDGGETWKKTHRGYLDGVYSSYGYYFGIIAVNTSNQNKVFIGGVPLLRSDDGGKTFTNITKENVHADHQALWVNPKLPGHIIDGNDGGVNISYDDGENWIKNNQPAVGQYYYINVDNNKPYNVYGGLQDNGTWYGPNTYEDSKAWEATGQYPYKRIGGGDGMQVQIDNRDNSTVYFGSQFGSYFRVNLKTGERIRIHPKHELGDTPYRFNWQTPILLSPHNQDILYMGANKLLRSMDQGENFTVISDDLTKGGKPGNVPYGSLTTIAESPLQFGLIYTGSDDGYIHVTNDGGNTWTLISDNLPQDLWVSRIVASSHEKSRVYVTLNGYRNDDFTAYVFESENMGKTWTSIANGITNHPVNVIKEDPVDPNILYVGTDNELYVSLDRGNSWNLFENGLPKVAIHDVVIQTTENDLLVGTHGRSIYKANISLLHQYQNIKDRPISLLDVPVVRSSPRWGSARNQFSEIMEPNVEIPFFVAKNGTYSLTVSAKDGTKLFSKSEKVNRGYNFMTYGLQVDSNMAKRYFDKQNTNIRKGDNGTYYLPKGEYNLTISSGNSKSTKTLTIK